MAAAKTIVGSLRAGTATPTATVPAAKAAAATQRILVLVACPGAGKSYFSESLIAYTQQENERRAQEIQSASASPDGGVVSSAAAAAAAAAAASLSSFHPRQWIRVNQDQLGSRRQCEFVAEQALRAGHSLIVDRTNIDIPQRHTWIALARRLRVPAVESVELRVPIDVCKQRVMDRKNHETLPPSAASLAIVDRFLSSFVPPTADEGFTRQHVLEWTDNEDDRRARMQALMEECNRDD